MMNALLNTFNQVSSTYLIKTSRYRKPLSDLPPRLYSYWQRTAAFEFKGIPQDAFFFVRATEGLFMFFDCIRSTGLPCGLPSKAADSVWHAWMRLDPEHFERFCLRHFGRTFPHTEKEEMSIPMEQALAHTLVAARALDKLPPAGMNVPRLFSLDRRLRMPDGYAWSLIKGLVGYRDMDRKGKGKGEVFYLAALASPELLAAGLVSQEDYDAYEKKLKDNGGAGGCGSGCGSTACDGGGGSSCGSSCGGGCGGGCG
jgi:hypothetical protein